MPDLTVGSLFAGIGGLDLGAERAGLDVAWQCEIDDYCRKILNKHWPHTPTYKDVRTLYRSPLRDSAYPAKPDVLCGGFPCQDISLAGTGGGLSGERSGLWWEFARVIRMVRPRYVVVENVPALVHRGLDAVLGWLATHGYDAEWQIVSAAAMGAPHIRERLLLLAYPKHSRISIRWGAQYARKKAGLARNVRRNDAESCDIEAGKALAHASSGGRDTNEQDLLSRGGESDFAGCGYDQRRPRHHWETEPQVDKLADGIPDRVDRTRALGNAVVPAVAEFVFQCIADHA